MLTLLQENIRDKYLDYFNNYLTLDVFAEHNELTIKEAELLLELGKSIHEKEVAFYNYFKNRSI